MERIISTRGKKPSTTTFKQREKINLTDFCFECKKEFKKYELEIEHEIPVCIGGDIALFRIFCKECHKQKTAIDITIISFFKQIGFLEKINNYNFETPLTIQYLITLYKELYCEILHNLNHYDLRLWLLKIAY